MSVDTTKKHPVSVWISLGMIGAIVTGAMFSNRPISEIMPMIEIALPILGAYAAIRQTVSSALKR